MKIRAVILALLYILMYVNVISAQDVKRVKIYGNVRDVENSPLELVTVSVKGTVLGAVTNEKGYYTLNVSTGDSIVLVFRCMGYNTQERIIPQLSQDMRVNVKMPNITFDLGEVSVTASRRQMDMMESIDAGRIKTLPDPSGGSIESMVVTYAGVSSNNELSSQYSVRGGSYDENIVYVNGLEVFRPLLIRSGQQEGLSFINPEMTENVQFSAGGFEARYGDKMSSVLDIVYKKPKYFEGSVTASLLGASAYVGNSVGKFTQITGIRYKTTRSLLGTLDTKGEYNPDFVDLQTYITYALTPKLSADFMGNVSINNYNFTPKSKEVLFGTAKNPQKFQVFFENSRERDRFQTFFGALTLKYTANDNAQYGFQTSMFNSNEEETYDITGSYRQDLAEAGTTEDDIYSTLGGASYHEHARNRLNAQVANVGVFGLTKLNATNTLKFGINAQYELITDRISEWESRDSSGYSLPHTGTTVNVVSNLFSDNQLESQRYSAYIQDIFKFRTSQGIFTLIGGLRGSYWNYNREMIISPRLSAGFIPNTNQNLIFRLATGLYYQPPFYKELRVTETDEFGNNYITLNKQLKSQRSTHFILGGDYNFQAVGRPFKFTTEMYYKKLDNINPYTVDNVKVRYYGENSAKGYAMGLDMKLFGEFVQGTDSWLSVSLMKSRQTIGDTLTVPMPNDQIYNISLYFQDYFPGNKRARMSLKGILAGGLPVTISNRGWESFKALNGGRGFRTAPYRRVDIGFSYQLAGGEDRIMDRPFFSSFKNIWFGIDIFNLLNISNTNSYYWITDVYNNQYAVPNYLTGRQLNFRISVDF
ncbi:MAG: TonB-dependent receptor [Tannerella sp.]|jgi:hypothetical protein|nr:TonB-dependent receptor [Tannerella sp.]